MGAMAGVCCGGRNDQELKAKVSQMSGVDEYEKSRKYFDPNPTLDDVGKFELALENDDVQTFADLLSSSQPIKKPENRMHPWAADPTSVGALAATQLAILAAKTDQPEYLTRIRNCGGIEALVKLLSSEEEGRLHAAVVALSFLSAGEDGNSQKMYEAGALPHLVTGMTSPIDGMRAACAHTARNIYVLDVKYREEFKDLAGIHNLIQLLDLPSEAFEWDELDTQLEAIYHLDDLIMDEDKELPEFIATVKRLGAVPRLERLAESTYEDLAVAARNTLRIL